MDQQVPVSGCRKCGKCCRMLGSPPFLERLQEQGVPFALGHTVDYLDMPEDIPANLRWEYQGYMAAVRAGRAVDRSSERLHCFWWDSQNRFCKHYRYRPKVCRVFYCAKVSKRIAETREANRTKQNGTSLRIDGLRQADGQPLDTETIGESESC